MVGLDNVPVQVRRGPGERVVHFLTTLLNRIIESQRVVSDVKEQ